MNDPMSLDPLSPQPHFPGLAADPSIKELRAEVERLRARDVALCELNAQLTRENNALLMDKSRRLINAEAALREIRDHEGHPTRVWRIADEALAHLDE